MKESNFINKKNVYDIANPLNKATNNYINLENIKEQSLKLEKIQEEKKNIDVVFDDDCVRKGIFVKGQDIKSSDNLKIITKKDILDNNNSTFSREFYKNDK